MQLVATQLNDLVMTTLRDLGEPDYTEIATDILEFTALPNLIKRSRAEEQDGVGAQWDVMVNHSGSASNVGLGAVDNVEIIDTTVQAQADWRNTTANWAFIGQEISMNSGAARIVNLVKLRRHAAQLAQYELMENNFWGPPVASTDSVTPWGVNTWFVKNASEGFNGGAPSGYTTIGLNPTTYPRWKNYTGQYTNVAVDDLIRMWRKAATKVNFKSPVSYPSPNTGNKYGYYTNYAVVGALEEVLQAGNQNIGDDVAKYDGRVMFRSIGVDYVSKLDADTTNPVYGINWGWFKTIILKGWWQRDTAVPVYPGQHTLSAYFVDSTYQFVTKNRRVNFVLATGTTYPS